MRRFKLIINPQADRGHTGGISPKLERLVTAYAETYDEGEFELDWALTERPRHATEIARAAAVEGYQVVVAVGGDGTVHEVVNGLMQIDTAMRPLLAILPVGSGNDFAYNVGVPAQVEKAVHCLFGAYFRTVDVGIIQDGDGHTEYWDNTVGIGFSGAVNIAARKVKLLRGFLLYLVSVLQTILLRPMSFKACYRIGQQAEQENLLTMLSFCNGPREGGGFPIAPGAKMDDGLINYVITHKLGRIGMLFFLPIVMNAKHLNFARTFEAGEIEHFQIQTADPMAIHTDGEVFATWEGGVRKIEIGIVPSALSVLCCEDLKLNGATT